MDVEKTVEFLLEQASHHDARLCKIEQDILQLNSIIISVATSQERTNEIVAVLAQRVVDISDLLERHIATHS